MKPFLTFVPALPALCTLALGGLLSAASPAIAAAAEKYVFSAGHPSLREFVLPSQAPHPPDNAPNADRIALGARLFFDPRLSGDGNMSCASCHNPALGWSDGLPTGRGAKSMVLGRASPTVFNVGYNSIQMWDGRKRTLEDQAMGPMEAAVEMNMDTRRLFAWLNVSEGYRALFAKAYPGEAIDATTLSKALAAYQRTIVSNSSPFDRWLKGEARAMSERQVNGFRLFVGKANCVACHSGPNFTDNGFHNVGLAAFGKPEPDLGRFAQRPVALMKGAFKTPTVREAARTAPYFHDGSARTLMEVVEHYVTGGVVRTNLSPSMKPLDLTATERQDLVLFMQALSSPFMRVEVPELPRD